MNAEFQATALEVGGVAVHAVASPGGAGEPAVLVHGLGLSHRYMMPLARALVARGRSVHAPDLPGFGSSGHPAEVLDVAGLADALGRWMDAAGLGAAGLIGNSFGCQIIAELAMRRPEKVARAVLQGPTTPRGERSWFQQYIVWRRNAPFNPPELSPICFADYRRCGWERVWRTFRLSLADRIEDKLPQMRIPTLIVRGARDPICHGWWAAELARLAPNGRCVEIPRVAHTLCYTAPEELAAVADAFLNE